MNCPDRRGSFVCRMPPDFCFPRVCPAVIHLCSSASRPQVANRSQAFRKHSSIELSPAFQKNLKSHTLHIINCYSFAGASRLKRAPKPDSRRRFSPSFSPRFPSGSANYTRFLSRFSSGFSPGFLLRPSRQDSRQVVFQHQVFVECISKSAVKLIYCRSQFAVLSDQV